MKYVPLSTLNDVPAPQRTYGKTRDCRGCRYWSELFAKQIGRGPLNCRCLNVNSPNFCKYMPPRDWCNRWVEGELGAVDDPETGKFYREARRS